MKLPYSKSNFTWLRNSKQRKPTWSDQYKAWLVPRAWFNNFVERTLKRYRKLYIIQPYREQEKCAPACWNAKGHECQCSCMGASHGIENPGGKWFVVSDTFAATWHDKELACRLLQSKSV